MEAELLQVVELEHMSGMSGLLPYESNPIRAQRVVLQQKERHFFFVPLPPSCESHIHIRIAGQMLFYALLLVGPPPSVYHALFCTLLHFQRMFHESGIRDQGIRDHEGFIWGFVFVVPQSR
jgi:hypothetical protein